MLDQLQRIVLVAITTSTLMGLLVRYVLVPYLRDQLIAPVQETHRQVTENSHAHDTPTVMDRIHDVQQSVDGQGREVKALARVLDEHLRYSDRWVSLTERELEQLRRDTGGQHHDDSTSPST